MDTTYQESISLLRFSSRYSSSPNRFGRSVQSTSLVVKDNRRSYVGDGEKVKSRNMLAAATYFISYLQYKLNGCVPCVCHVRKKRMPDFRWPKNDTVRGINVRLK
jgi:hypothetical protein